MSEKDRSDRETLRAELRLRREALGREIVAAASADVCAAIARSPLVRAAGAVALYAATRGEIDPSALRAGLHARGVTVAYPRVLSREPARLELVVVAPDTALAVGRYGILEPPAGGVVLAAPTVVLVPGIAFARGGHRLGFGAGYYDCALAGTPAALRIGLCHDFQLLPSLPVRAGDEPVDCIFTPRERVVTGARPLVDKEGLT